jgi:hypothetical protein
MRCSIRGNQDLDRRGVAPQLLHSPDRQTERGITLDPLKYAEIVIEQVHMRTIQGKLQWENSQDWVRANPTPAIGMSIKYQDDGPDAAIWEFALIKHPVGKDSTMIGNPASANSRIVKLNATGSMLDQMNEIFRHVVLDPREKEFEEAMKQLREP